MACDIRILFVAAFAVCVALNTLFLLNGLPGLDAPTRGMSVEQRLGQPVSQSESAEPASPLLKANVQGPVESTAQDVPTLKRQPASPVLPSAQRTSGGL